MRQRLKASANGNPFRYAIQRLTFARIRHGVAGVARRRRVVLLLVVGLAAVIFAGTAKAWSQYYVWYATFSPGHYASSDFNSNLDYHEVHWDSVGGTQTMFERLCSSGGSCQSPTGGNTGLIQDSYDHISYGQGKCNAWESDTQSFTVYWCYVSN